MKIDPMQVARLSTEKNHTNIHMIDGAVYTVRISLVNALKYLPDIMFVLTDRAEVSSVLHIDNIQKDHLLIKGKTIPIARSYYKHVVAGINIMEEQ